MAYTIGGVSGCHINPAVSLAAFIDKRISATDLLGYVISQVFGAIVAGAILVLYASSFRVTDLTGALGSNGVGTLGLRISATLTNI